MNESGLSASRLHHAKCKGCGKLAVLSLDDPNAIEGQISVRATPEYCPDCVAMFRLLGAKRRNMVNPPQGTCVRCQKTGDLTFENPHEDEGFIPNTKNPDHCPDCVADKRRLRALKRSMFQSGDRL